MILRSLACRNGSTRAFPSQLVSKCDGEERFLLVSISFFDSTKLKPRLYSCNSVVAFLLWFLPGYKAK